MFRTAFGAIVGGIAAYIFGYLLGRFAVDDPGQKAGAGFFLGIFLLLNGSMTGAVIGGIADLLAFLRTEARDRNRIAASQQAQLEPRRSTLPLD